MPKTPLGVVIVSCGSTCQAHTPAIPASAAPQSSTLLNAVAAYLCFSFFLSAKANAEDLGSLAWSAQALCFTAFLNYSINVRRAVLRPGHVWSGSKRERVRCILMARPRARRR